MELCITRWDVPLPTTLFLTSEIDAPLQGIHIIIVSVKNPYPYPNQGVNTMDTLWRKRIHIWINASFVSIMFFRFSCVLTASFYQRGFFYNLYPKTIENVVRVDVFEAKRNDIWIKQVRQLFRFFASTPRFLFFVKNVFFRAKNRKMRSAVRFAPLGCPLLAAAPEMWCCSQIVLLAQKDKKIRRTLRCDIFP